ncbi:GIY-YIG nuclease family protein [Methylocaldum sp.]|uniref:GIY-YIG nuclease family protein n=1 Tax=Methylocaldum sp. TaxID=1969727 RepID=UPI002D55774D|nr:GIY-YIG nuclease family protein [Methylocaldum sp.]HYE37200.1 GIY-YIG nuclease family protein [Methylocaldum sp.]
MGTLSFSIEFEGYWREKKKGGIPAGSGVYCVYTCIYSGKKQTCSPQKLVYIGASENVRDSLADHVKQADWESHIDTGEELCFSFVPMDAETLERCAAALIFKHKPPENTEYVQIFPFDRTSFTLSGKAGFLSKSFTV